MCRSRYPFNIQLCIAGSASQEHPSLWRCFPLSKSSQSTITFQKDEEWYSENFELTLTRQDLVVDEKCHTSFTVKYRISEECAWQWLTVPAGFQIGEIILQEPLVTHPDIGLVMNLSPGWHTVEIERTNERASLWCLQSEPIQSSGPGYQERILGLVHNQARYFAVSRIEPPWVAPRHGDSFLYIAENTVLCSILRTDGNVVTVAAPSMGDICCFLMSNNKGAFVVHSRNDGLSEQPCRIMVSVAPDIDTSISVIMKNLQTEANDSRLVRESIYEEFKTESAKTSHLDPLLDYLGFCTWNALGLELTQDKILEALRVLRDNNIRISTLLMDDNWQKLQGTELGNQHHDYRGLADFRANEAFPDGLKSFTTRVKAENPFVTEIGVWHALMGYWGGLATEGWVVDNYETVDVAGKVYYATPTTIRSISASDLNKYYDDFYTYLAASGITFVKTDVQCLLHNIRESSDRAALIPAYQAAWTMAHFRRLGGKAISCMSQIPEILWQSLLQTKTPAVIFRNSDDFFPEIPSSHMWHIWTNAHNALFTQHLNVVLDWDMFQSKGEYGPAHAAARCLSGGPIFLTDTPGEHDLALLDQMVAPSPDGGRSVNLRPSVSAKTPRAFDRYQESGVLKVITEASIGVKCMGLFNTRPMSVAAMVPVSEFSSIGESRWEPAAEVVVLSHQTQAIRGPVKLGVASRVLSGVDSLIEVNLPIAGYEILSCYQTSRLMLGSRECLVVMLGLLGKMTGAAAICSMNLTSSQGKIMMRASLKALGKLGIWISGQAVEKHNIRAKLEGIDVHHMSIVVAESSHNGETSQILTFDLLQEWSQKHHGSTLKQVPIELELAV